MFGWMGQILRVDLTTGTWRAQPLNQSWAREDIGVRGVGARYLHEEVDPTIDPLSPTNNENYGP